MNISDNKGWRERMRQLPRLLLATRTGSITLGLIACFSVVAAVKSAELGAPPLREADQVVQRGEVTTKAIEDSRRFWPDHAVQDATVRGVQVELISLAEADRRLMISRGQGGYAGQQTESSPVWWVRVQGDFRLQGAERGGQPRSGATAMSGERIFIYDAKTGQILGSRTPQ